MNNERLRTEKIRFYELDYKIAEIKNEISEFEKINDELKEIIENPFFSEKEIDDIVKKIIKLEESEIERIVKFLESQNKEIMDDIKKYKSLKILEVLNQMRRKNSQMYNIREVEEINLSKAGNNQYQQNNDEGRLDDLPDVFSENDTNQMERLEALVMQLKKHYESIEEALEPTEQKRKEAQKRAEQERKEKDNFIREQTDSICSLIFDSTIIIRDNASICPNFYGSYFGNNSSVQYCDSSIERIVLGVCFDYNEMPVYCDRNYADIKERIYNLLKNGAKLISIATSIDGERFEGMLKMSDVKEIKPYENNNKTM